MAEACLNCKKLESQLRAVLKREEAALAEIANATAHLHAAIEEKERAEQQNNDLAVRHAALLTQNVQQEEEIADLERQVCGMREALGKAHDAVCDGKQASADLIICDALTSAPKCRHEEEKERADMLHDLLRLSQEKLVVGEAGGRLLKAVQEKTEAQYNELLFAVCRKFPDESRHETALRYIREAELKIEWGSGGNHES